MIICTIFSSIDGALCLEIGVKITIERNKYIMKFSDLMLDMATGDASIYDAYIQEAVGKINVSHAYFEAACKISELPEGEDFMIVQEAADAGLPTDTEGSAGVANEAVVQELNAFFDLIVATSKKVKQGMDKNYKALVGLGKGLGVSATGGDNFVDAFAKPLAAAVVAKRGKSLGASVKRVSPNSIELGSAKFLANNNFKKLAKNYIQAMAKFLSAYGLTCEEAFNDPVVRKVAGSGVTAAKSVNLHDISNRICSGIGQIVDKKETSDHGSAYRTNVSQKDIAEFAACVYAVKTVSDAVVATAGGKGVKKNVSSAISNAVTGTSDVTNKKGTKVKKSVSSAAHDIDECIKCATPKMTDVASNLVSGYTDSVYALVKVTNGGKVPLPTKTEDAAE
jgi:hypothetical protein